MARLLLIDNDEKIVALVALLLRKLGHEVRTAPSFARARGLLDEARPDLLLSDYELGAERADEELSKLAIEGLLPPTLVVSGYLDDLLIQRLLAIPGVLGTLKKPFDLAALQAALARALEEAERRRAAAERAAPQPGSRGHGPDGGRPDDEGTGDDEGWEVIEPSPDVDEGGEGAADGGGA
jgi:DNA-binding NtrC family response regulator